MGCALSKNVLEATVMRPSDCSNIQQTPLVLRSLDDSASVSASATTAHKMPPVSGSGHRDVFSIFGERGMVLQAQENEATPSPTFGATMCSPFSASGSVFSTATTASDTERTHIVHGPVDQFIPALNISFGAYSDKGMRKINEDRQVCTSQIVRDETVAYFGIYDGHGGIKVADHLAKNLHLTVYERLRRSGNLAGAIQEAFAVTDDHIFKKQIESGSTALSVVIRGRDAIVACVGDSQAVLSTSGKARPVSIIHSPDDEAEKERITAAKGVVVKGRIFGLLSVSRSFGDNDFKTSRGEYKEKFKGDLVTAVPDLLKFQISQDDDFLVMGCDGLFEVMEPQQVVDFVRAKLTLHGEVQHACEELVSYAISIGSTDNVSATVVCFNQAAPQDNAADNADEEEDVHPVTDADI